MVVNEINIHSKLVSENLKTNLTIQKKDYETMLKRLGTNLQDALVKIKTDMQFESNEIFSSLENKINSAVKIITEDTNNFGVKWDTEL